MIHTGLLYFTFLTVYENHPKSLISIFWQVETTVMYKGSKHYYFWSEYLYGIFGCHFQTLWIPLPLLEKIVTCCQRVQNSKSLFFYGTPPLFKGVLHSDFLTLELVTTFSIKGNFLLGASASSLSKKFVWLFPPTFCLCCIKGFFSSLLSSP